MLSLLADEQSLGGVVGGAVGGAVVGTVGGAVVGTVGGAVVGTVGGGAVPPQAGIVAGVHTPAVEQEAYMVCPSRFVD